MGESQLELSIIQDNILRDFALSLIDFDKFLFYLWIIQTKLNRKLPTKEALGVWFETLNAARKTLEFRKCYELFKKAYDFIKEDIPDWNFFTESQVGKFQEWYKRLTEV